MYISNNNDFFIPVNKKKDLLNELLKKTSAQKPVNMAKVIPQGYIKDYDFNSKENKEFTQLTNEALSRMDSDDGEWLSAEDFLDELETW